jgi:hypothetical protein
MAARPRSVRCSRTAVYFTSAKPHLWKLLRSGTPERQWKGHAHRSERRERQRELGPHGRRPSVTKAVTGLDSRSQTGTRTPRPPLSPPRKITLHAACGPSGLPLSRSSTFVNGACFDIRASSLVIFPKWLTFGLDKLHEIWYTSPFKGPVGLSACARVVYPPWRAAPSSLTANDADRPVQPVKSNAPVQTPFAWTTGERLDL